MGDIDKLSKQIIDYAERLADVADAAQGKGIRRGHIGTRWFVLPAVGAGLYALATNGSFARRTKSAMEQAKARASDLPEDLLNRVRQTSTATGQTERGASRKRSATARSGSGRKTSSSRNRSSARKPTTAR